MRSQKNRNLLWRLTAIHVLLFFCLTSCDKEDKLMNRWNLQHVSVNGGALKDSSIYHLLPRYTDYVFFIENSLSVETYIPLNGQFTSSADGYYKLKNSTLEMRFRILNQKTNITAKIKKLTKKELHLEYSDKGNTYLLKLYTN